MQEKRKIFTEINYIYICSCVDLFTCSDQALRCGFCFAIQINISFSQTGKIDRKDCNCT